jgi:glyoxylase-like metal-dependent hydrolase (beta-lactamase superfamily II)
MQEINVRILILCCALLGFATAASAEEDTGTFWNIEFQKLHDDIYVAHIPDPKNIMVMGNVTVIINDKDVVLVDGGGSPVAARRIIAGIRKLTPKPVSVVVNTHGHGDHSLGNQEYVKAWPGVEIIARPETRDYMTTDKIDYVKQIATSIDSRRKHWDEVIADLRKKNGPGDAAVADYLSQYFDHDIEITHREYQTVVITPPDLTFTGSLTLYRGAREIRLLYVGKGHTDGDVVVYLPHEKILATGDLVVAPIPYGFDPYAMEGSQSLDALAAMDFDTLVPGHGPVEQGKAYLNQLRALLADVQAQVRPLVDKGLSLDDVLKQVDMRAETDKFAGQDPVARYFFDQNFVQGYVEGVYNELKPGS